MRTWHFLLMLAVLGGQLVSGIRGDEPKLGGETTLTLTAKNRLDRGVFSRPAPNLTLTRRGDFFAGNSFFQGAWIGAPASTKARDGLGPLFNTMSCQSCHVRDGRGRPPKPDEEMLSMLIRVSLPDAEQVDQASESVRRMGAIPDPVYGFQIQNRALLGSEPEAIVGIQWEEIGGAYPDGTKFRLRRPSYVLEQPGYGPFSAKLLHSGRVAPSLIGVGLLDTIPVEDLRALEDPEDEDGDGVSGRLNQVWDVQAGEFRSGRFGWKAEQPSVKQQVAAAFHGDLGLTSSYFPEENHSVAQASQLPSANGGTPEVDDEILDLVNFYCKTLAVPSQRNHDSDFVRQGKRLFQTSGCATCHREEFTTGVDPEFPELSEQVIHPYTDLLLHDMGDGLADGRPVFGANGREWRTPPLWGLGLVFRVNRHTNFLHDGRARSIEEAILWHGGEAEASKLAFMSLKMAERRKLLAFLKSL